MDRLRCVVERITYQNEQNGYSIIKVKAHGYNNLVTVVGAMPEVHVGAVLTLTGEWKMDAKYGRQFSMVTFEETLPATVYGIEKYLGSGLVKGIGPKFASRIVKEFGAETLNVIEEDPDSLIRVPGIGKVRVERIKNSWVEQKKIKNIMLFLQSHGVSTAHATKIWKTYGDESLKVVQENPYRLADDIWGIWFKPVDTIAEKLGFEKKKFVRLRSGLLYTLNKLSEEGHCYALRDQLVKTGAELLSVEEALISLTLDEMIRAEDVKVEPIGEGIAIYLPPFYFSEVGTARRIKEIFDAPRTVEVDPNGLEERITRMTGMTYDPVQMDAIITAVQSKILVLTGGPGTEALESKAAGLTAELTGINTQIAALIQKNAATAQDQVVYDKRYAELTTRYEKTKRKQDGVLREIESRAAKARALDAFERELREIDTLSVSFTSSRWNAMVERVDVFPDGLMSFRFVCGREIVVGV